MGLEATDRTGSSRFETQRDSHKASGLESDNDHSKESDKEELKSVKDLIQFLIKTTRTLKIYLHNNPIHQKFIKELKTKFDQHLKNYDVLKIRIRQYEFVWNQEILYENTNRMDSLPFRLYMDGIREITFLQGLEQEEIVRFLEALGKDSTPSQLDDDMTTILWEKGFTHITYQIAEDQAQPLGIETIPMPSGQIMKTFQQENQLSKENPPSGIAENVQIIDKKLQDLTYQNIYALTEEEISKIKHEMKVEEARDLLAEMIQIFTSILEVEDNLKDFEEVLKILQDMLELMIGRGDFYHARRILEVFWEFQSPEKGLSEKHQELLRAAIDLAGSGDRVDKLKNVLDSEEVKDFDHMHAYLILHRKNAIPSLINLLGTLEKMKPRRILCEAMVELARDETGILVSRLTDRRWYTVRNIVYILGKIGNEQVVDSLASLMRHPESRVRKEVLRAYEILPGNKSKQYLMRFLQDVDSSIRIQAAKSLAQSALLGKVEGATERFLETIGDPRFKDRDLYEKKEMFDALGRVGGNAILPMMQKIIRQRMWFRFDKGRIEELRLCAVIALKRVKTPEAVQILWEGAILKNKNVREACLRVLNELDKDKG
jgi:HEAT repeat protein